MNAKFREGYDRIDWTGVGPVRTYDHPGSPMHGWPVRRRTDAWAFPLLEVFCPHGVGHPMPESVAMLEKVGKPGTRGTWGVHGCDGCCLAGR